MKKVYVAGKFEKKDEILNIYDKLKNFGFEIAYDWTQHKNIKPYKDNIKKAQEYSNYELEGIKSCDIYIYLTSDKGHTLHMELGAALMLAYTKNKPIIYAVGKHNDKSPWLFNKNIIRKDCIEDVFKHLENNINK